MDQPDYLVCMRLADMRRVHPHQDNSRTCGHCGHQLGIYPSGQEVIAMFPAIDLVCHVCHEAGVRQPDVMILAPGAEREPFESVPANKDRTQMSDIAERRFDANLLPARMNHLPRDKRGFIVPWFVDWIDNEPVFPAFDPNKFRLAVRSGRCWVCGGQMGRWMTFVVGPMCVINRVSAEPPSHIECAEYSAKVCPFLANPSMRRVPHAKVPGGEMKQPGGMMETRNPGLTALWRTRKLTVINTATGPIVQMGDPEQIDWWYRGRLATPYEVHAGFDEGAVLLRERALEVDGESAMSEITRLTVRARKLLPPLPPGGSAPV